MKHSKILILLGAVAILSAGCKKEPKIKLDTVTVTEGSVSRTVTATGTLESVTQVEVGTQVTGIIDKLYADFNSVVKKGELIAELDKTILQADLNSSDATLESARVTYEYTKENYDRDRALYAKNLISQYDYQTSEKDYRVAQQQYEKAKSDRVRAAKNLNYAEIYSPMDGIVISRAVEVGQTVVSNMSVANLFTIADLDHMQVVGNVDEADIGQVKVGQKVRFTVDSYPDDTFEGNVTQVRLAATTESNVVTYEVIVSATNEGHKLIPGMTANLTIYVLEENGVMTLPVAATKFHPRDYPGADNLPKFAAQTGKGDTSGRKEGKNVGPAETEAGDRNKATVYVLRKDSLIAVPVTLGASNGVNVAILSGLRDGDTVATGYSSPETQTDDNSQQKSSPFAPKRPGRK